MAQTFPVLAPIITRLTEVSHSRSLGERVGLGSADVGESLKMRKRLFQVFERILTPSSFAVPVKPLTSAPFHSIFDGHPAHVFSCLLDDTGLGSAFLT